MVAAVRPGLSANEREPPSVIVNSVRNGTAFALCAVLGDVTIGLATAHLLKNPPSVFLVYLAAAPDQRSGKGVGTRLFFRAWDEGRARLAAEGLKAQGMVWEVDRLDLAASAEEADVRRRRLAFFLRNGGELLPARYLQPPVDGVAPVEMQLMFLPQSGVSAPESTAIRGLIRAIYFEKYGAANGIAGGVLEELLRQSGA